MHQCCAMTSFVQRQLFCSRSTSSGPQRSPVKHALLPCRPRNREFVSSRGLLQVRAAQADAPARARPGEKKGFVEEMRFVAMRLHTKDQAPREGQKPASPNPMLMWQPTRENYLKFLTESKVVYDALEAAVQDPSRPEYVKFRNTGLERSAALARDIEWMQQEYGLTAPQPEADGPGATYAKLLQQLAREDPPAFLCHYYNIYFAHSAGGRMIGTKVADKILDRKVLGFYKYDGDMKQLLEGVRDSLNQVAGQWSREAKDHCLEETEKSFQYSGALIRIIIGNMSH